MSKKAIKITNRTKREMRNLLKEAGRFEGDGPGGGTLYRPSLPLSAFELVIAAASRVIDKHRIPLSIEDEIAVKFELDGKDRMREMQVIIREREDDY